jgi:ubiquinone biosynthesis protein
VGISVRPEHLKRYAQIARVIVRHGGSDLVRNSGLSDALGDPSEIVASGDDTDADLADDLEALGPTFVKLGQLLATRSDLLPAEQIESLSRLQDDVAPVPFDEIRDVVETELGARISNVYGSFEEEPLASASLGQVHRATLRDGRELAVKVQRPGIREIVVRDLEVLESFASLLDDHTDVGERYRFTDIVAQFERSLLRELDYRREAVSLDELRGNLQGFDLLTVPETVPDLVTPRVLTMERMEGTKVTQLSGTRRLDIDGEALIDQLFQAYLQQMFTDGFVHADPHPGNVLLTADGRLALIDVGMVVRLESSTRERLLRLVLGVADGKGDEVADVALELGQPTSFFDEERFRRDVSALVGSYHDLPPESTAVGGILSEMTRISGQDGVRPPPELTLLARTLMALDQVARELAPNFEVDQLVRRHASEVMSRSILRQLTPASLLRGVLDTKELVESLPARVNAITSSLADGSLRVRVDIVDAEQMISALKRLGNRVTAGLVLAALIVGAALMARVETQTTVLGYPALALVFFVVASVMGLWMVVSILRSDD